MCKCTHFQKILFILFRDDLSISVVYIQFVVKEKTINSEHSSCDSTKQGESTSIPLIHSVSTPVTHVNFILRMRVTGFSFFYFGICVYYFNQSFYSIRKEKKKRKISNIRRFLFLGENGGIKKWRYIYI